MFSIYETDAGGVALWTETDSLTLTDRGVFVADLGDQTSLGNLDLATPLHLGIEVAGQELTPRFPFRAAPTALTARALGGPGIAHVYHSGDDLESGQRLLDIVGGIQDASSSKPYSVILAPGIFRLPDDSSLVLPDRVSLVGFGPTTSKILGEAGSSETTGAVVVSGQSVIQNVGIESRMLDDGGTAIAVYLSSGSDLAVMDALIEAAAGDSANAGLSTNGDNVTLRVQNSMVRVIGDAPSTGVAFFGDGNFLQVRSSEIFAQGDTASLVTAHGVNASGDSIVSVLGTSIWAVTTPSSSSTATALGCGVDECVVVGSTLRASETGDAGLAIGAVFALNTNPDTNRLVGTRVVVEGPGTTAGVQLVSGQLSVLGSSVESGTTSDAIGISLFSPTSSVLELENSRVTSTGDALDLASSTTTFVGNSRLAGGGSAIVGAGAVTCFATHDGTFQASTDIDTCP